MLQTNRAVRRKDDKYELGKCYKAGQARRHLETRSKQYTKDLRNELHASRKTPHRCHFALAPFAHSSLLLTGLGESIQHALVDATLGLLLLLRRLGCFLLHFSLILLDLLGGAL